MSTAALGDSRYIEQVCELLRQTAAEELMPRFRNLQQHEIREKRPGDLVTVADVAAERRIAAGLARIVPGVPVIGEEAVADDAGLLQRLDGEGLAWIVDPLDGTANFTSGKEAFATIVCLTHNAEPIAGWILHPVSGALALAMKGAGATLDGEQRRFGPTPALGNLNGFVGWRFQRRLSEDPERKALLRQFGHLGCRNCAGVEYIEILGGQRHFSLYRWTKPWDHAAGALMVREAGGIAARFDRKPYVANQAADAGILTAPDTATWETVHEMLLASPVPLLAAVQSGRPMS